MREAQAEVLALLQAQAAAAVQQVLRVPGKVAVLHREAFVRVVEEGADPMRGHLPRGALPIPISVATAVLVPEVLAAEQEAPARVSMVQLVPQGQVPAGAGAAEEMVPATPAVAPQEQ